MASKTGYWFLWPRNRTRGQAPQKEAPIWRRSVLVHMRGWWWWFRIGRVLFLWWCLLFVRWSRGKGIQEENHNSLATPVTSQYIYPFMYCLHWKNQREEISKAASGIHHQNRIKQCTPNCNPKYERNLVPMHTVMIYNVVLMIWNIQHNDERVLRFSPPHVRALVFVWVHFCVCKLDFLSAAACSCVCIPLICHGSHGYIRVNFFGPV